MRSALPTVGHLPPHATDLEAALLGAMMLEAPAVAAVLAILHTEQAFHREPHQFIFRAIRALFAQNEAIDQLTVVHKLRELGLLERVGGAYYVANLTTKINSSAHLEAHCRIVQQFHIRRELIATGTRMAQAGYDQSRDELELLAEAQVQLIALHSGLETRAVVAVADVYDDAFRKLAEDMAKEGLTGVPTGLKDLNHATGGWQPSDLVVMAARPGMGKTAAMLHFARVAALDHGQAAAIFSMEMPTLQLVQRMIASEVEGYTNAQLRRGEVAGGAEELNKIYQSALRLKSPKLLIDDTPGLSIHQLRAKCARLKADHDVQLILVDYIQLMKGEQKGNREQEIGSITRGLKEMAKELNVPVLALSQLSRSVETRGGEKRPQLSDLRESGSIEQDADMVIFLWRGEYYGIAEYEDGAATADTILFDVAKQRNGALGPVIAGCSMSRGCFHDLSSGDHLVSLPDAPKALPRSQFDDQNDTPF